MFLCAGKDLCDVFPGGMFREFCLMWAVAGTLLLGSNLCLCGTPAVVTEGWPNVGTLPTACEVGGGGCLDCDPNAGVFGRAPKTEPDVVGWSSSLDAPDPKLDPNDGTKDESV